MKRAVVLLLVVFAVLPVAAAARDRTLVVQLDEWNIVPSDGHYAAGRVRIEAENDGRLTHQLVVTPTVYWGERLAVSQGRAEGVSPVASPLVLRPGERKTVTVTLRPGFYVLLDNLPGHYQLGTWIPIVVQ